MRAGWAAEAAVASKAVLARPKRRPAQAATYTDRMRSDRIRAARRRARSPRKRASRRRASRRRRRRRAEESRAGDDLPGAARRRRSRPRSAFCEVMAGRDPAGGVLIQIPPHKGPATLTFDLHNLHLYSEEQVQAKRGLRALHGDHRRADDGQHAD